MHVRFSRRGKADLRAIYDYIAEHNPPAAASLVDRILIAISNLESFPLLGRPGRVDGTRELITRGLPYVVVYSLVDEYHINIERILHGAQLWPPGDDE